MEKFDNAATNVLLATLTHNFMLEGQMARTFYAHSSRKHNINFVAMPTSLLAAGYNQIWCQALNQREEMGWKYLAILHADIVPEDFWLDKLIQVAEWHDADLMSAIVPIKDAYGTTSTAISRPKTGSYGDAGDHYMSYSRLTQTQVNDPEMPIDFDIHMLKDAMEKIKASMVVPDQTRLLVNTGCCVIRLDRPWCRKVHFTINDRIVERNGLLASEVEPEDWFFSRRVAEEGGRVMATKHVKVTHVGRWEYHSNMVWGKQHDHSTQVL